MRVALPPLQLPLASSTKPQPSAALSHVALELPSIKCKRPLTKMMEKKVACWQGSARFPTSLTSRMIFRKLSTLQISEIPSQSIVRRHRVVEVDLCSTSNRGSCSTSTHTRCSRKRKRRIRTTQTLSHMTMRTRSIGYFVVKMGARQRSLAQKSVKNYEMQRLT